MSFTKRPINNTFTAIECSGENISICEKINVKKYPCVIYVKGTNPRIYDRIYDVNPFSWMQFAEYAEEGTITRIENTSCIPNL